MAERRIRLTARKAIRHLPAIAFRVGWVPWTAIPRTALPAAVTHCPSAPALERAGRRSSSLSVTGRNPQTSTPTSTWRGSGFRRPWLWPCRFTAPFAIPFQVRKA